MLSYVVVDVAKYTRCEIRFAFSLYFIVNFFVRPASAHWQKHSVQRDIFPSLFQRYAITTAMWWNEGSSQARHRFIYDVRVAFQFNFIHSGVRWVKGARTKKNVTLAVELVPFTNLPTPSLPSHTYTQKTKQKLKVSS